MPTAQQKLILEHLSTQQGYRDYKEMAKEIGIVQKTFHAQLLKMVEEGLVEREPETPNWAITEVGMELFRVGGARISREDVGMTDFQLFEAMGASIGGFPPEKLRLITNVIFTYDAYDLQQVWNNFCDLGVSIDARKTWFTAWMAHLSKSGKPTELPASLQAQLTSPDKRTDAQRKEMEDQGRDWILEEGDDGLPQLIRIGPGVGEVTFKEGTQMVALKNVALRRATPASPPYQQEPISQLITALTPFLKPEVKGEKGDEQSLLRWVLETKMGEMTKTITESMPKQPAQKGMGDWLGQLTENLDKVKTLTPFIRAFLGIPEGPVQQAQGGQTPIQLQNPDGSPLMMNMGDFLTIQKFQAEQRREDESQKGKQEMASAARGFLEKIGEAAARMGGKA